MNQPNMKLEKIKSIDDFEQFGPTENATSDQIDTLNDIHAILSDHESLKVVPVSSQVALNVIFSSTDEIVHCPIDLSSNRNANNTDDQQWILVLFSYTNVIALSKTDCGFTETAFLIKEDNKPKTLYDVAVARREQWKQERGM